MLYMRVHCLQPAENTDDELSLTSVQAQRSLPGYIVSGFGFARDSRLIVGLDEILVEVRIAMERHSCNCSIRMEPERSDEGAARTVHPTTPATRARMPIGSISETGWIGLREVFPALVDLMVDGF